MPIQSLWTSFKFVFFPGLFAACTLAALNEAKDPSATSTAFVVLYGNMQIMLELRSNRTTKQKNS
jgi:hypothetical protein